MFQNAVNGIKRNLGFKPERKSYSLTDPVSIEIFGGHPTVSGVSVTANSALQNPAVLHAIRLIAETVGSLPCKLYREEAESKEPAKDNSSYRLVHDRANEWTSAGQMRVDLTTDALMHGSGFAELIRFGDGRPFELHRLTPGTVRRCFEDNGEPYYLIQQSNGRSRRLSYRDVLYVSAFGGMSPVKLGKEAIGVAMILERHASQFFGSGTRPSGVISNEDKALNGDAGAKTISNILKSFRIWRQSANGDPLILDGGWKFDQPAMTSTDAQFLENRIEQINEIARIFGVPPSMLYQLDRATWGNAEQMAASFLQLCLRPWLDKWQDAYATALLTEDEHDTRYFEFVVDDLQRADAAGRAEIFSKLVAMRAMTPNEVRAAMNLPAMDGGDELANPYTTTSALKESAA